MSIRLIDTTTLHMKVFVGDNVPEYAILSHTWVENEEVDYQEMNAIIANRKHPATRKLGYRKIYKCCEKAEKHGIKYAWVDTCCIDKSSSTELSEAINSMFKWYYDAEICYAYLADMPRTASPELSKSAMRLCRYWGRGWTLQELIAPSDLRFYDGDWKFLGSKETLRPEIQAVTGINEAVLNDCDARFDVPVGLRMSWASRRNTTRTEDLAYCLLGIFDVNMPLLYGEGHKAFTRLQEEIIRRSNDLSVFWTSSTAGDWDSGVTTATSSALPTLASVKDVDRHQASVTNYDESVAVNGRLQISWYRILFARSPRDFGLLWGLEMRNTRERSRQVFALTNNGVHFENAEFYHLESPPQSGNFFYALYLGHETSSLDADMVLQKIGPGLFVRCQLSNGDLGRILTRSETENAYVITNIRPTLYGSIQSSRHHAIRFEISDGARLQPYKNPSPIARPHPAANWNAAHQEFLTMGNEFTGYVSLRPWFVTGPEPFWTSISESLYCYLACSFIPPTKYRGGKPYLWVKFFFAEELEKHHRQLGEEEGMKSVLREYRENHFSVHDELRIDNFTLKADIDVVNNQSWPSYRVRIEFTYKSKVETELPNPLPLRNKN